MKNGKHYYFFILFRQFSILPEATTGGVLLKKMYLKISQNLQENTYVKVSFLIKLTKKETLAHMFSCEFCEISKNTFFTEHLWATASVLPK